MQFISASAALSTLIEFYLQDLLKQAEVIKVAASTFHADESEMKTLIRLITIEDISATMTAVAARHEITHGWDIAERVPDLSHLAYQVDTDHIRDRLPLHELDHRWDFNQDIWE